MFKVPLFNSLLKRSRPLRPPEEDIHQALVQYMAIPGQDLRSDRVSVISDESFNHISKILLLHPNSYIAENGRLRPRIFTVLHHINRNDVFPAFVESGFTDSFLPIPIEELPDALGCDKSRFVATQKYCLTDAAELEKGEHGRHIVVHSDQPFFITLGDLGSGGFGHVDQVWSRLSMKQYARKRFLRGVSAKETKARFDFFAREIGALKKLHHKHLTEIIGTYTDSNSFAFLMEPVADYDLEAYLYKMRESRIPTLRCLFGCLASALTYLHQHQLHHLDIKPRNILIKGTSVYLADFGAAHDWSNRERSTTWSSQPRTTPYMPPEVDADPNAPRNYASDIWSLGVVYLEMLTVLRGQQVKDLREHLRNKGTTHPYPYKNNLAVNSWLEILRKCSGPDYDNIPQTWVKDMLARTPENRPFAKQLRAEILQTGYFCGFCCRTTTTEDFDLGPLEPTQDKTQTRSWHADSDTEYKDFPEQIPLEPARVDSIQAWIHQTGIPVESQEESPDNMTGSLQFEIEDDGDVTMRPAYPVHQDYRRPILEKLSQFDFCAGLDASVVSTTHEDLVYEVDQDGGSTSASEVTLELGEHDIEVDSLSAQHPPDLSSTGSNLKHWLEVITEECFEEEQQSFQQPILAPLEDVSDSLNTQDNSPEMIRSQDRVDAEQVLTVTQETLRPHVTFAERAEETSIEEAVPIPVVSAEPSSTDNDVPVENRPAAGQFPEVDSYEPISQGKESRKKKKKGNEAVDATKNHPASLTKANLEHLNEDTRPQTTRIKWRSYKKSHISAKKYMRKVSVETDSEATSVMSEATYNKIKGLNTTSWLIGGRDVLLDTCVRAGKVAATRAILDKNRNLARGKNLLMTAIRGKSMRHVKCADALLRNGANPNITSSQTGRSALSVAIEHNYYLGYKLLILLLLKYGADPNQEDKNGDTALLQILYGRYEPLAEYRRDALALIFENSQFPVDVDVSPLGTQNKPIHLAVRRRDPYATGMLLAKGADVSARNGAGLTAFALAITGWTNQITDDQKEVAWVLLKAGADVNEKVGPLQNSALHVSIRHGLLDMAQMLMYFGADAGLKNKEGQSAFDICTKALAAGQLTQEMAEQLTSSFAGQLDKGEGEEDGEDVDSVES